MVSLHKDLDDGNYISAVTTEFIPAHFVVRIEAYSLLSENGIDKFECAEFEAGGHKWRLIVYPNGKECTSNCDDFSVYLSVAEPNSMDMSWEVTAMFGIFLHNQVENNFQCKRRLVPCRFNALSPSWGLAKFISNTCLLNPSNGYLVNDTCVFGADVFVLKRPGTIECLSLTKVAEPYFRSWTISNYSKLKGKWKSKNFRFANQSWFISLGPGGAGDEAKGRDMSIFLSLVDEKKQSRLNVKFTFRMKDQAGDKHCETIASSGWFGSDSWSWAGFDKFMPIADMNDPTKGFLVNDCCILETELAVLAVAHCSS